MVLVSIIELFRMAVMTLGIGYIFSSMVQRPTHAFYTNPLAFDWPSVKLAALATAPAVILHELGHKFTALALGVHAEFFASYFGLGLGIFLKLISAPFIIFVPGYVQISANAGAVTSGAIALAGPLVNLALWLAAAFALKALRLTRTQMMLAFLTKRINMILFFFNLIPFGFFDGAKVLDGILSLI